MNYFTDRYQRGKRHNSFYMDMPEQKESEETVYISKDFRGYSYYLDAKGKTVQEILRY